MTDIKIKMGLIEGCPYIPSPNWNERPSNTSISLIVIHCISLPPGEYGGDGITQFFTNQLEEHIHEYYPNVSQMLVSCHILIRRDGSLIQYVPFHKRAWHAGVSTFQGKKDCNDFSIGIELEGTEETPFEPIQYEVLANMVKKLMSEYPDIQKDRVVGHSHISPGRKCDPGDYFDWEIFYKELDKS